jgi:hypothetical protein
MVEVAAMTNGTYRLCPGAAPHPMLDNQDIHPKLVRVSAVSCASLPTFQEVIMLQPSEIQQRFSHVQQVVNQAEEVCRNDQSVPNEIRDCIQKLAHETDRAQSVMQSNDQSDMVQCIDDLEAIGDEAKRVCTSTRPSPQVQSVVVRVHDELSNLKHQLH